MRNPFPMYCEVIGFLLCPTAIWLWETNVTFGTQNPALVTSYIGIWIPAIAWPIGHLVISARADLYLGNPRWWAPIDLIAGLVIPFLLYRHGIDLYQLHRPLHLDDEISSLTPFYVQIVYSVFCLYRSSRIHNSGRIFRPKQRS